MAVAQYKTYIAGEVLTAADLNASLTNITDNGEDLAWPATQAKDFDGQRLILDGDADTSITADTDDIIDFELRGQDLFKMDGASGGTTVNGLTFRASAAGADVQIQAQGGDTNIDIDIVPKGSGSVLLDGQSPGTAAFVDTGTSSSNVPLVSSILGERTVFIPSSAMYPATTNGCSFLTQVEGTAGRPELSVLDFDGSTAEYALFHFALPKAYNNGTVQASFYYAVSAAVSTTVRWELQAVALSDSGVIDSAFGTAQGVTDTYTGTSGDLAITSFTSSITIAGTPANEDMIFWRVGRQPGSDSTSQDARLLGIKIKYTINALKDD